MADDLVKRLDKLSCGKHHTWASFRQAVKRMWTHKEIKAIITRLSQYRDQVLLRLLVSVRDNVETLHLKFEERLQNLRKYTRSVIDSVVANRVEIIHELQRLVATDYAGGGVISQPQSDIVLDAQATANPAPAVILEQSLASAKLSNPSTLQQRILNWLWYRMMSVRHDEISQAHQDTFKWIYEEGGNKSKSVPWDDFVEWLQSGNGCYWISGKAGSGKSTLMKFLYHHEGTRARLDLWAASASTILLVAPFFFWEGGTPMQRSLVGLLRAILYEILSQRTELIAIASPDLLEKSTTSRQCLVTSGNIAEVEQPSELINLDTPPVVSELTKALAAILNQQEARLNILLVIDGLDEYEGDPGELAKILTSMATSTQKTKLFASSRPIPACLTAFGQGPKLRLQDLTRQDICRYVQAELNRHPQFCALAKIHPERADSMIRQVTERSEGVFLWVKLAVRSVLVGLENGDRMNELESRLSSLPTDLDGLYERMLERTPLTYQPQGAQMLLVVRHWPALQAVVPFHHQRIHFTSLLLALGGEVTQDELDSYAQDDGKADRYPMIRCGGLLEASNAMLETLRPGWPSGEGSPVVQYIHKTVAEFLKRHSVSQKLDRRLTNEENVNVVILDACIREIELANQTRAHVDHTQHALLGWQGYGGLTVQIWQP